MDLGKQTKRGVFGAFNSRRHSTHFVKRPISGSSFGFYLSLPRDGRQRAHAIEGGTALLLYPGIWHRFKPSFDTGWEEFWVGFRGHYAEYLMRQECFDPQQPLLPISSRSEFLNVFTRLIDTLKYEGTAYRQLSTCQIIQLLGLVYSSALVSDVSRNRREQIVHQVRYQIQGSWEQRLDFSALAIERNVSYVWLRKAFKEVMGVALGQYHLNLKIEKAIHLLGETDLGISEIAYQTGFESLFYFSRIFRKKTSFSPSEFRAMKLAQAST